MMETKPIAKIRQLMLDALNLRGISGASAEILIEDFLGAQLSEKFTHGLGKFLLIDAQLAERTGAPTLKHSRGPTALVNGNRELGQIAARFCIDELTYRASEYGVAAIGLFNASRYSRLATYGDLIARNGLVGILMNNAGPPAVAPTGSIEPLLGTNPVCFAFPSSDGPIVFDFATSQRVWGEIRQAMLEERELSPQAFIDKDGRFTREPECAEAVLPFGGHKGYALCLAIEVLCGALVGAKMGKDVRSQFDLGFLFLAIDPRTFGLDKSFQESVSRLASSIRDSRGVSPGQPPRVPGEMARQVRAKWEAKGQVLIDKKTFSRLKQMSTSLSGGLEVNCKTD